MRIHHCVSGKHEVKQGLTLLCQIDFLLALLNGHTFKSQWCWVQMFSFILTQCAILHSIEGRSLFCFWTFQVHVVSQCQCKVLQCGSENEVCRASNTLNSAAYNSVHRTGWMVACMPHYRFPTRCRLEACFGASGNSFWLPSLALEGVITPYRTAYKGARPLPSADSSPF